jgi:hypothetical protein
MKNLDLDALLNDSAPPIHHPANCEVCREASRRTKVTRGRTRAAAIVLTAGVTVGIGGVAAATGGASLATHLGWMGDNAVSNTNSDGNRCHVAFRALPETGVIGQPPTLADAPEVREAQAFLSRLDLDAYVVPDEDVQAMKDEYRQGLGAAEAARYTDSYYENQALFVSVVDAVRNHLDAKGMPFDKVVTLESANECTERIFKP